MKQSYILIGAPGSGKSTFCKDYPEYVRISQDDMGQDGHRVAFMNNVLLGKDIIVDRMGFNKEQRGRYVKVLKEAGYEIHAVLFRIGRQECLERMQKREGHPTIKDDKSAISALDTFFKLFEEVTLDEGFDTIQHVFPNVVRRPAIMVDLDNTLCDNSARQKYMDTTDGKKKDWKGFFENIHTDVPCEAVAEVVERFSPDYKIVYCSGRPIDYETPTREWMQRYEMPLGDLVMRTKGDFRADNIVKRNLYLFDIAPYYDVLFVLDDRQQVTDEFRSMGLKVFQVEPGQF